MIDELWEQLEDAPQNYSVWCHPATYRELVDESQGRDDYAAVPPTPEERFGKDFCVDHSISKRQFRLLPESVDDLTDENIYQSAPLHTHVRELINQSDVSVSQKDLESVIRVELAYEAIETQYKFEVEKIKETESIPLLERLIRQFVPENHPPASPEHVIWESNDDVLEIDYGGKYWTWTYSHENAVKRVPFTYTVDARQIQELESIDPYEYHFDIAIDEFTELAIETIGTTQTKPIIGWKYTAKNIDDELLITQSGEPVIDDEMPEEFEFKEKRVDIEVGQKIDTYGDMVMRCVESLK